MTTIGRWSPNKVRNKIIDAQWVSETRYALELVKPSSVVVTGGGSESATISSLGSVEFSAAATLSLNGVFSSGYDNYMVVMWQYGGGASSYAGYYRLRSSGSDATGSNYTHQYLSANNTSVSGARTSSTTYGLGFSLGYDSELGSALYVYGPALAQPTASRSAAMAAASLGVAFEDAASTHSLSTAYDGLTLIPGGDEITGRVAVYGMRG